MAPSGPSPRLTTPEQLEQASAAEQQSIDAFTARRRFRRNAFSTLVEAVRRLLVSDLDGLEFQCRHLLASILAERRSQAEREGDRAAIVRFETELVEHFGRIRELAESSARERETP